MGSDAALVIRADASVSMGTGHIMRCLALAQAWRVRGGVAHFVSHTSLPDVLRERLASEGFALKLAEVAPGSQEDADALIAHVLALEAETVVVDGYHFGAAYQHMLKTGGLRVMFLDDNGHAEHYAADWVLNQNPYASEALYPSREAYTTLLLGSRYALLRREFWPWRGWQRQNPEQASRVLITLGGSDPENVTLDVLQSIEKAADAESLLLRVVVGAVNPHLATLKAFAAQAKCHTELVQSATNMADHIAWAELAVSAAGSTTWELCLLGIPVIVVVTADNQRQVADALAQQDKVIRADTTEVGRYVQELRHNTTARQRMSEAGQMLVDGYGAQRAVMLLRDDPIYLRPASTADCEILWRWANDPEVRRQSFLSHLIGWEEHQAWFANRLKDARCHIYMAVDGQDNAVGQIRFDADADGAYAIDYSVSHSHRGLGLGKALLIQGTAHLLQVADAASVYGLVKVENRPSRKAFEAAGFREAGTSSRFASFALVYVKARTYER